MKTAVVTGGSRGIGKAVAKSLAASGYRVAVIGRDLQSATNVSKELPVIDGGFDHFAVRCDISNEESRNYAIQILEQEYKCQPEILVNSAGISKDNLLLRCSAAEISSVIDTNLVGTILFTKGIVRSMLRARRGCIVTVGSVIGAHGGEGQTAYAASKAGLVGFTKSIARELGTRSIRANLVEPGFIDTDMTAAMPPELRQAAAGSTLLGRLGSPEDVAAAVAFLCSPQASYITGQVSCICKNGRLTET